MQSCCVRLSKACPASNGSIMTRSWCYYITVVHLRFSSLPNKTILFTPNTPQLSHSHISQLVAHPRPIQPYRNAIQTSFSSGRGPPGPQRLQLRPIQRYRILRRRIHARSHHHRQRPASLFLLGRTRLGWPLPLHLFPGKLCRSSATMQRRRRIRQPGGELCVPGHRYCDWR